MFNYSKHTDERTQQIRDYSREHGQLPWRQGWNDPNATPGLLTGAWNPTTGRSYGGMNKISLLAERLYKGYDDSRWMTYKQALSVGGQVRRGERSTTIIFWDFSNVSKVGGDSPQPQEGEALEDEQTFNRPIPRPGFVFNAAQIDGLPPPPTLIMPESIRNIRVRELLERHAPKVHHDGGNRAFYMPFTDSIHLPKRSAFENEQAFVATLLHELSHWTGSPQRLARDLTGKIGSESYAFEELVAELSSVLIQDRLGASPGKAHFENHVAYLQHWEKLLKDDSKALFRAAAQAEKVMGFLGIPEYEYPMLPAIRREHESGHGQDARKAEAGRRSPSRRKERQVA